MRKLIKKRSLVISLLLLINLISGVCKSNPVKTPIRVMVELNIGESQDVRLKNGIMVRLKLLGIDAKRDSLRHAIRGADVKISIDGKEIILNTGNYNLPVTAGNVQIDCPVINNYYSNTNQDRWGLLKQACFRLWPKGSPYMEKGSFMYPIKQEWLASLSQASNEPTYVDGGENPDPKSLVYYHAPIDIGGAEGMDEIISATDGLVISSNNEIMEGNTDLPGDMRKDVIYVRNDYGWIIRYSHLDSIFPSIKPGAKVKAGQKLGYIGKQGASGGWVHLHFGISHKDRLSGKWGNEDAYAYIWEAYTRQYKPSLIAVARPHQLSWVGIPVTLNGNKSRSLAGKIVSYEWIFSDGSAAAGAVQEKVYDKPGEFSEILKVTDSKGNIDYDFTVVQVYNQESAKNSIPAIQAAYHPTLNIKPGEPVVFLVRTFNSVTGNEVWNFGDGSAKVEVHSETVNKQDASKGEFAKTTHSFSKPGHYLVSVQRTNEYGYTATGRLHVVVMKNKVIKD